MDSERENESGARLKYAELMLRKGMQEEALEQLCELVRLDPDCARAHYTLAVVRAAYGSPREASEHFQDALRLNPGDVKALNGLGVVLQKMGRGEEAASCYREAVRIDPLHQDARLNLAILLRAHGQLCAAERELAVAVALQPEAARLRYNLANCLHFQGRSLEAVAGYRDTLRLDPGHLDARQNLLFALHYSPRFSDRQIYAEHLEAASQEVFKPPQTPAAGARPTSCGRPIRVGYLSADFRDHAVARFIEPILANHDRSRFEIYCYANLGQPDQTTQRLREMAHGWRDICRISDEQASRLIAEDAIDILVDLAGHTSGNRLPLFARKPAPLQVTWIGYPDTTGLPQMDYRITDRYADPPGETERYHSERLIRLPRTFSCYCPPPESPPVAPLPLSQAGRVTFGSFNNLAKVTPELIELWAQVLLAVPGSRMLIKCAPLGDPEVCARVSQGFQSAGVDPARLDLQGGNAEPAAHLAQYGKVDIALDSFPYNGTTTSCEALWMGVPVVSLAGTRHASRTGTSILTNCGLPGLVAQSRDQYISIACELAGNPGKLAELRSGLRETMRRSPLMDAAGVTRELEAAFLAMLEEAGRT